MFYLALIGLLAILILLLVNYDILFQYGKTQNLPAIKMYRRFLFAVLAYYISDTLWGVFSELNLFNLLFANVVIYYIVMAAGILTWTRYVVTYLGEEHKFGKFLLWTGRIFFVVITLASLASISTPVLFWFDDAGEYHACPARYAQLIFQIVLFLLTTAYTFSAMLRLEGTIKKRHRTICFFGLVIAVALILQLEFLFIPMYTIGYMLGTCLLHTFVISERVEEYRRASLESLRREKEAAEQASQGKSEFLSNMSHEIRTPINAVLGMNELILRECEDENILSYAENVRSSGNTLLGLINDILDFSKIEAGKIDIIPVDYDLSSTLNDMVVMIHNRADDKGLAFNVIFDSNIPKQLFGDEVRIKQVITNILTNAVKYTETGSVTFSVGFDRCEDDPDCIILHVKVKDTGIGIKPEDMEKLFSKFERIEEKRNRNIEGTGLGMTITKNLLDMMGSYLQVESTYGVGSTFFFDLRQKVVNWEPLGDYRTSVNVLLKEHKKYKEKFTAPDANVLVVDDNSMNLTVFKSLLKRTKIKIDTADSGDEALQMTKSKMYDMIFLDHMMPGKDGIETLHEIKEQAEGLNDCTVSVCLTANAVSGAREQYIAAGFDNYLTKPIHPSKLEDMLMAYLPGDKLIISGEDDVDTDDEDEQDNVPESLAPLVGLEWIDLSKGIKNSGDAESYLSLLKILYESIDEESSVLDGFYKDSNLNDYTIQVHAMKSSVRLIGASSMADEAQLLENAGKDGDEDYINQHHEGFISAYKSLKEPLSQVFAEENVEDETENNVEDDMPEADAELMDTVYEEVKASAEANDAESIEAVFAEIEGYRIPDSDAELCQKIRSAAENSDFEAILTLLSDR
ncbi:MAG: response regulator [Anaerovibrio sp.]|uniref:ATP-binding protein n=1 Tax=Anaerovibrio sp. TaxID=1872532 RepID=UPI001B09DCAC|nr:ATP-binding protein [Anaerovibrio sp.]MBO6245043.1 response regulator [Anaerovibrio sp.]